MYAMKSKPIGGTEYQWRFHAWAESGSNQYDPSAKAIDATTSGIFAGSWGGYEDDCLTEYRHVTNTVPLQISGWETNQPGQSTGCEEEGVHTFHYEYDDGDAGFPAFIEP